MSVPDSGSPPSVPRDEEGPVFSAPWEAQAFAIAVMLHERGQFTWKEFTAQLAGEIAAAKERGEADDGPPLLRVLAHRVGAAGGPEGSRSP